MADQLSLFDPPPAPANRPEWQGLSPVAQAQPGPAPQAGTPAAAPAPSRLSEPVTQHLHPQAQRRIVLAGGHLVAYALQRSRRRSIGFAVCTEGLTVRAPRWLGQAEVEAALHAKASWILRKLQEQRQRGERLAAARVDWREGATLPFLGQTLTLVLDPRITGARLQGAEQPLPGVPHLTLHLGLPQQARPEQLRDAVQSWLQRQARRVFEERCALYAPRLGVQVRRLALSSATTRWGSASADGSIRLNWRLVHFAMPVIDYVVTHELAHLREMNHSPAFWDVVRSALPGFEAARGQLRTEVLPVFD